MIRAFVSSTYRDLKDHRGYVIDRLARGGIYVDPMEKWSAASDEPKVLSQERVRDCQLCILLVGFRRGHVPEGETRSITQMEYAEALRRGLQVLVFMANEQADWPAESVAALDDDPALVRWRSELREHKVVGLFSSRPESIDVDAALNRWLQEQGPAAARSRPDAQDESGHTIDIRAYGNSEGVLIVWRSERPIEGCLGFALYREILGDAGITQEVVGNRSGWSLDADARSGSLSPSTSKPIQNFRWFDRGHREARYRVVPVVGTSANLSLPATEHTGSAWTGWVSPRTGQIPGCRAFFNAALNSQGFLRKYGVGIDETMLRARKGRGLAARSYLGGGLRQRLLELLTAAKVGEKRVYAALAQLDDPELITALKALGQNVRLILGPTPTNGRVKKGTRRTDAVKVSRELEDASVHVHKQDRAVGRARSNFVVSCDRWGAPLSVFTGSGAWTTAALCLHPNNGVYVESVPLARSYLDRWYDLLDPLRARRARMGRTGSTPPHIRERGMFITVWNTPTRGHGDLRDASRLIRGARQGVLFLVDGRRAAETLMDAALGLARDNDLFVEGLSRSRGGRGGSRNEYVYHLNGQRQLLSQEAPIINSTIILVDPLGPHPVVMSGSHDLSLESSEKNESDLLVIENVPSLATEYAAHLVGMFDHFRWRAALAPARRQSAFVGLQPTDAWQGRFFKGTKRAEFNFLFGLLSPGL